MDVRWWLDLRNAEPRAQPWLRHRFRLSRSANRSARGIPALQNASICGPLAPGRQDDAIRCEGNCCGWLACNAAALRGRRVDCWRQWWLFECRAPEGNSFSNQERDAGCGNDLRGLAGGRFFSGETAKLPAACQRKLD